MSMGYAMVTVVSRCAEPGCGTGEVLCSAAYGADLSVHVGDDHPDFGSAAWDYDTI